MQSRGGAVTKDVNKRDVAELARILRVQLPQRWTVGMGWQLCLARARVMAESYRQPPLPNVAAPWAPGSDIPEGGP
jgi:hypothetical protein